MATDAGTRPASGQTPHAGSGQYGVGGSSDPLNSPTSAPAATVTGTAAAPVSAAATGPTSGTFTVDTFLAALKLQESGDYTNHHAGSSASGAYQYIDSTWNGYGGYAHAWQAPPAIQDQRARADVTAAYKKYGSWDKVAVAHFAGPGWLAAHPDPATWDQNPVPGSKNPTVSQYVASLFGKAGKTAPAGVGSSGPAAVDPNAQTSIDTYGYIAALAKTEPDLANLMKQYAGEDLTNASVQQRLEADIQNTHWWRSHNNDYRKAEIQKAQDPASYQRAINDQVAGVTQAARAYLIPMDEHTARVWASRLASGLITPDDYKNYLKEQGKSLFPGMAAAIDSGVTPETYVQPYKTLAAQTLEIPPESVNFLTPKWGKALFQVDPKTGARTSMSLADWQNTLRSDPMYGFDRTEQARTTAADLTTQLGHEFGAL